MDIKLYTHWNSVCTQRVRIALNYKEIVHELIPVKIEDFQSIVKMNPIAQVPILSHKGVFISESMAIIHYIDREFSGKSFFPKDHFLMGKVMNVCEIVNSHLQPHTGFRVFRQLRVQFNLTNEQKTTWAHHFLHLGLSGVEKHLQIHSGNYSFGDEITAADFYVVPQAFQSELYNIDLKQYPNIKKVYENCYKLPAFQKADVLCQIDTPKGLTKSGLNYVAGNKDTGIK